MGRQTQAQPTSRSKTVLTEIKSSTACSKARTESAHELSAGPD